MILSPTCCRDGGSPGKSRRRRHCAAAAAAAGVPLRGESLLPLSRRWSLTGDGTPHPKKKIGGCFFTDPPPPRTSCFHLIPPGGRSLRGKSLPARRRGRKKTPPCLFADRLGGFQEPSLCVLISSMFTTWLESPLFFGIWSFCVFCTCKHRISASEPPCVWVSSILLAPDADS